MNLGNIPIFQKKDLVLSDYRDGIAVRSPNWLGDAVMSIPAMHQLRRSMPRNCGLFVAAPKQLFNLFMSLDFVDVVIPLETGSFFYCRDEMLKTNRIHAGIGLLLTSSFRDALLFRLSKIPKIFGASSFPRDMLLTESFAVPGRPAKGLHSEIHQAGIYLSMAYSLGAPVWDGKFPELRVPVEKEMFSKEVIDACKLDRLLAVAPGAAYGPSKKWSPGNFNKVCREWIAGNGNVVILGSAADKDAAEAVHSGLPPEKAANLAGKTDMAALIAILKNVKMCVANDSGIMHLAAAMGVPGVAIFGSTDPTASGPLSDAWTVMFEKQDCSPCRRRECIDGGYRCLDAVTPEKVAAEIEPKMTENN